MNKQAWCIKGPDGRLCTTISTISEQDAWDIFMGCDDSPDRYKADGYRAVPVTVSEQPKQSETQGYALAMAVLQSDLYHKLDDEERAECDEFIRRGMRPVSEQNAAAEQKAVGAIDSDGPQPAPAAAPSEFVRVPREPTDEMLRAAWNAYLDDMKGGVGRFAITYRAMLAAAPPCPDAEALLRECLGWFRQSYAPEINDLRNRIDSHLSGKDKG